MHPESIGSIPETAATSGALVSDGPTGTLADTSSVGAV